MHKGCTGSVVVMSGTDRCFFLVGRSHVSSRLRVWVDLELREKQSGKQ